MEEKNRIEASGTVKRTRKKTEKLSLSERLAALAEERALEARYAEQYRAQLLERMSAEPEAESDEEVVAVADAVAVMETVIADAAEEVDAISEPEAEDALARDSESEDVAPAEPAEPSDALSETDVITAETDSQVEDGACNTVLDDGVRTADENTESSFEQSEDEVPAEEIIEDTDPKAEAEDSAAQGAECEAEDEPIQNAQRGGTAAQASSQKRQIKGYIAVPMYHYGMGGTAPYQGTVMTADGGATVTDDIPQPIFYPRAVGAAVESDPFIDPMMPASEYASPASVDTADAVAFGEQYTEPVSTEPSIGSVAYGETYADSVSADAALGEAMLREQYGSSVSADPTVGAVSLSEEYGSAVNAEASVDEVALGETYASPIDVKTSGVAEIPMDQGYDPSELEGDRLAHDRGADVIDIPYSADSAHFSQEYPHMTDIDHRPSVRGMDTIELAADKIEENVLLIEQRLTYEIKALKRLVKIHNYTFSLDSGAHCATTHELKYSIKQRASKLSRAKKLEKKTARRYYLATLDKHIGDVKKRQRNRELISSILRRLEFIMEERSRINQRLIALYSGKSTDGERSEIGLRQSNRAARDMYKRQKGRARYVSRLYVERDVKERILELMNERTECAARMARIKRQLRSHGLSGAKRRGLKSELREARRRIKYLGADIKHFIKRAEIKHEHNSAQRRQRIIVGGIVLALGAAAIFYLSFKEQIDAFLSNLF